MAKKGERIGAVLIVGGPEVVPFHHLPNPTDDGDPEVLSDNPYSTSDSNYFIPEWPVGRLPGEAGSDAGMLLDELRKLTTTYKEKGKSNNSISSFLTRIYHGIGACISLLFRAHPLHSSFGYSAQVWRISSDEVYRVIGQSKSLLTSPPLTTGCTLDSHLLKAKLGYFNLHGIADAAEWYGQKCLDETSNSPEYPVALSPKDINCFEAPFIIFSEACYGAYLNNYKTNESLALKFLSSGTQAFIGSTCVAYGSVTKPLIGADLLGHYFWEQLCEGYSVGNALTRSKINLAQEMVKRQGYLDGEDQKTLLSFVLYGDPLATIKGNREEAKVILRSRIMPVYKTVTDRSDESLRFDQLSPIMMAKVKETVQQYLPGLQDGKLALNLQSCSCKDHTTQCHGCKLTAKGPAFKNQKRVILTLSKDIKGFKGTHHIIARMTLDPNGKMLKLSTSR
jgi:hypothetical protein